MAIGTVVAAAVAVPAGWSLAQPAQPAQPARCLHGPSEAPAQKTRRDDARKLAEAINRAENGGPAVVPGQRRTYRPLDELGKLPPTPAGFKLQLNTDGSTYTLSVRDTLDACHFTIFSDQEMWVYEATPRNVFEIRPVESSR
jgi:hypothetical protein